MAAPWQTISAHVKGNMISTKVKLISPLQLTTCFLLIFMFLFLLPTCRNLSGAPITDLSLYLAALKSGPEDPPFANPFEYYQLARAEGKEFNSEHKMSLFAFHYQPFFYILYPLYKLAPYPGTLFFIQALIIASAIFPLYYLAISRFNTRLQLWTVITCFFLYPSVLAAGSAFFPIHLSVGFLIWALFFAERGKHIWFIICLIFTVMLKENCAIISVSFAAYYWLLKKEKAFSICMLIGGIAYFLICTMWVIPHYSPIKSHFFLKHFYHFGKDFPILDTTRSILSDFFSLANIIYLLGLLAPLAFLPLVRTDLWMLNAPTLLQNMTISQNAWWVRLPYGHLSSPLMPFTILAFLEALKRFNNKTVYIICLGFAVATAPFSMPAVWGDQQVIQIIDHINTQIPAEEPICTNIPMLWESAKCQHSLALFPADIDKCKYVAIQYMHAEPTQTKEGEPVKYIFPDWMFTVGNRKEYDASVKVFNENIFTLISQVENGPEYFAIFKRVSPKGKF